MKNECFHIIGLTDFKELEADIQHRCCNTPVSYKHLDVYKRQVVSKVKTVTVGLPATVTVRLMIDAGAFAATNPIFQTAAGKGFSFLSSGIHRGTIASQS